ncbi:MAG: UDP-N-acetylmuramate dehydrogenase [Deltaproteobacteria bacterium]|nr:UDP-N-acetylmuramate dehydrogenase [Deltaproteobacteria bacterium]MBW2136571.1 UDP-N-acetylmuramate dehydrogenase [Deltaproteobacteria bacterium]
MNHWQKDRIVAIVDGAAEFDYPMSRFTVAGVGGKVDALCRVRHTAALEDLVVFLTEQHIPYFPLGKGSNVLVTDRGFRGVVIVLEGKLSQVEDLEESRDKVRAGAGLALGKLLDFCRSRGLGGLEFLAGIPGTVGGAIAMNAGAFGCEFGGLTEEVRVVLPGGESKTLKAAELEFSYRSLSLPKGAIITMATMRLRPGEPERIALKISRNLRSRRERQPLGYPSCGSVFKNPSGDFAGRLIEESGLKGRKAGGAMISPKHANFIVNTGGARARDFLRLMELARRTVKERTGIELEPEIRVIG